MTRKNVLVKVSGDKFKNPKFLEWVSSLSKRAYTVITVGGGTQINEEFKRRGLPVRKKGPAGREPGNLQELQVARDVLEANGADLEDTLAEQGIFVHVDVPFRSIGGVLCPIDGDLAIQEGYTRFEELYVITTADRRDEKVEKFKNFPKVTVLPFD
ncbi:MAG: hypothetical protein ABSB00_01810 [Minisyncoccia bacterium]|jgi:acetylglutamate kinase